MITFEEDSLSEIRDTCKVFQRDLAGLVDRIQMLRKGDRFGDLEDKEKVVKDNVWFAYRNIDAAMSNFGAVVDALDSVAGRNHEQESERSSG